jgi:hypothetical protein
MVGDDLEDYNAYIMSLLIQGEVSSGGDQLTSNRINANTIDEVVIIYLVFYLSVCHMA